VQYHSTSIISKIWGNYIDQYYPRRYSNNFKELIFFPLNLCLLDVKHIRDQYTPGDIRQRPLHVPFLSFCCYMILNVCKRVFGSVG